MYTTRVSKHIEIAGVLYTSTHELSSEHAEGTVVSVPDESTDFEILVAIDISQIVALFMVSDQDVTIETNDGTTPDQTINLKAGAPLDWDTDAATANPITADVTALYVTNASGAAATVKVLLATDPTV